MKSPFSREYFPPAPVISVEITAPGESPSKVQYTALIDTGADGTFVPTRLLEELGVPIIHMTNVRAHMGESLYRVSIHRIDFVLFDSIRFPNIEVVADDWGNGIILGRNLLNKLNLHLDGPSETTRLVG